MAATRTTWLRRLWLAAAAFVALIVGLEVYTRWPAEINAPVIDIPPTAAEAVLLFHGSYGAMEPTLIALEQQLRERVRSRPDISVQRYVWSPWSDTMYRAAARSAAVGVSLGASLASNAGLRSVHLIAHSAGAYLLDPLCEALRAARTADLPPLTVRMTFLDPIGFRGVVDLGWGSRQFGRCADRAEAYINTDDSAPATNRELRHARTIDVTAAPQRAKYDGGGHRWPVQYYLEAIESGSVDAF